MGLQTGPTQPVDIEGQAPRSFSQAEIDLFERETGVPANFVTPGGQVAFTSDKSRQRDINPLAELAGSIDAGLSVPQDTGPATFQEEELFSPPAPAVEDVGPIDAVPDTSMNLTASNLDGMPVSEAQTDEEIQEEEERAALQNDVKEGVKAAEATTPGEASFIDRLFENPEVIAALSSLALIPLGGELGARLGLGRASGELIGASSIATGAKAGVEAARSDRQRELAAKKKSGTVKSIEYVDPETGQLRFGSFDPTAPAKNQFLDQTGEPLPGGTIPFVRPFPIQTEDGVMMVSPSTGSLIPIGGLPEPEPEGPAGESDTPTSEDLLGTGVVADDDLLRRSGVTKGQIDRLKRLNESGKDSKRIQKQADNFAKKLQSRIDAADKSREAERDRAAKKAAADKKAKDKEDKVPKVETPEFIQGTEDKLRREYNSRPEVDALKEVQPQFSIMQQAGSGGPGSIAFLIAYMKILDPNSVVREGEFATAENAQGVPAQIRNMFNKVSKGSKLDPSTRNQFLNNAAKIVSARQKAVRNGPDREFRAIAKKRGLDPDSIVFRQQPKTITKPSQSDIITSQPGDVVITPKGKRVKMEDGSWKPIE